MRKQALKAGDIVAASVAGFVATVPMTVTMLIISRFLHRQRQPLDEPRKITNEMLERSGLDQSETIDEQRDNVQLAAHFAYGASVGSLYPVVERIVPLPKKFRGPAFGLGVYAASYAGWLPAFDILPPPQRRPIGRNVLLIAAHIVWGASLAAAYHKLRRRSERSSARPQQRRNESTQPPEVAATRHHAQRAS